jgi:hypothetical protein
VTRVISMVLLLAAAVSADVVLTETERIEGIVTMPDSMTISVSLPLGGMRILRAADVRSVSFDGAVRYRMFEVPMRALGILVDTQSSGTTTGPSAGIVPQTQRLGSVEYRSPAYGRQDQLTLLATFQSQKRDPAMAGLLSAFVPTLGHVYAGEGGTGTGFLLGEAALVALAVLFDNVAAADTTEAAGLFAAMSTGCWAAAAVTKICECGDAVNAASRYNQRLQERLGLQIGLQLLRSEATFGVACRF